MTQDAFPHLGHLPAYVVPVVTLAGSAVSPPPPFASVAGASNSDGYLEPLAALEIGIVAILDDPRSDG